MAEYITEGAVLRCDQGQYATELKILSSRMCIGGKLAANHKDCVPMKNIFPFGLCSSRTYGYSAKAKEGQEHPCVLDLMEQFYLPDKSQVMSEAIEQIIPLEVCIKRIREIIGYSVNEMTKIQHLRIKQMNYRFSDEIAKHYAVLWKATDNVFTMRESLSEVKSSITAFYNVGIQNCTYLAEGNEDIIIAGQIAGIMEKLKELANQEAVLSGLPKVEESYLITMESFGICRCGGILKFEMSGQI